MALDAVMSNANIASLAGAYAGLSSAQLGAITSAQSVARANAAAADAAARAAKDTNNLAAAAKAADAALSAQVAAANHLAKQNAAQAKSAKDSAAAQAKASTDAGHALKQGLTSPLSFVTEKLEAMGPKGVAASMALKVGFTLAAAAIAATVGALTAMSAAAIAVFSQRSQWMATFGALAGGQAAGARVLAIVEKLGATLPFATSQIKEWAQELAKTGMQGRALENAIKAVAAATAIMGESGGAAARTMITTLARGGFEAMGLVQKLKAGLPEARQQLAEMGLRIEDIAGALGMSVAQFRTAKLSAEQMAKAIEKALAKKGAPGLAALALEIPTMLAKAKEGVMSLFAKLGPAVRPFLKALQELFGQFYKGGAAARAMQPLVTSVMTVVFQWATKAVQAVSALVKWFTNLSKSSGGLVSVGNVLKGVWMLLGVGFRLTLAILGPLLSVLGSVVAGVGLLAGWAMASIGALAGLAAKLGSLGDMARGAAAGIVGGLIDGVDFSAFVDKMIAGAAAGLAGFKAKLGIASPSKVMAQMGRHTGEGLEQGIDDSADGAQNAMTNLVTPKGAAAKGGRGKGGGGTSITLNGPFYGVSRDSVLQWVREALEAEAGAGAEPELT